MKTTRLTVKNALLGSVAFGNMSASRTFLGSVPSIYIIHCDPVRLCLVLKEELQLIIRPRTVLSLILSLLRSFTSSLVNSSCSQSSQVFQYNRGSTLQRRDNLFGNAVIHITSEAVLLERNLPKVSFPRMSLLLKGRPQSLITTRNLLNSTSAKEPVITGHSQLGNASVNSNALTIMGNRLNSFLKNYIQKNMSSSHKQISRTPLPREILLKIIRNNKFALDSSSQSLNRNFVPVKPNGEGFVVVPDTGMLGLRTREEFGLSFMVLGKSIFVLLKSPHRLNSFDGFGASRTSQISGEILPALPVGFVVQGDSIPVVVVPRGLSHVVEGFGVSLDSRHEDLWRGLESEFDCSYHIHIYGVIIQVPLWDLRNVGRFFENRRMRQFRPAHEGRGSLAA
jgi:hypothetical protein